MGRRSITGGVTAKGPRRIQFEFWFEGVRYRPTLLRTPSEANLRQARRQLAGIKARITTGTFSFAEEFPEFRNLRSFRAKEPRERVLKSSMLSWRIANHASPRTTWRP